MIGVLARRVREAKARDRGFTLIELLISMTIFGILGIVFLTVIQASNKSLQDTRLYTDLNEEARLMLNRMSRELRQAQTIDSVTNPGGTGFVANADQSITFDVDFNGDGTIEPTGSDPETLTYHYLSANHEVHLEANGLSLPILASNVSAFRIDYYATIAAVNSQVPNAAALDTDGDGLLSWQELDADPNHVVGNGNGTLDATELKWIDSIQINVTVLTGSKKQQYRTEIALRNHV